MDVGYASYAIFAQPYYKEKTRVPTVDEQRGKTDFGTSSYDSSDRNQRGLVDSGLKDLRRVPPGRVKPWLIHCIRLCAAVLPMGSG